MDLHLRRATDYEKGFHDLRPSAGPAYTDRAVGYVYGKNASAVAFRGCSFRADEYMEGQMDRPFRFDGCGGLLPEEERGPC